MRPDSTATAIAELTGARLAFGDRVLWDRLDLTVRRGEFIAVLGPNGTGKTSLLKVLLRQQPLTAGRMTTTGAIGYVPQHRSLDTGLTLRGRDLVGLGFDGHRWGFAGPRQRAARRAVVAQALGQVDGSGLADVPVSVMSGGELQRVRIAQALASDPTLLLCDEPLLNLDPANAQRVSALIDQRRKDTGTAVLFVTHEVNPVLPYVDRVLYLVDGRFRIGAVDEVMTSETLSELYRADIQVARVGGQYVVVGEHGTAVDNSEHASGHSHD
ncbi:metal ABC transporter ATP-binding protein [Mycobacterium sp. OTB74]|uniref:metal ABC transporter ATP-binding protein n=1 Tax=Mycobacterium sp. OTB74 TaxID=1853452 RepID=UPI0024740828|nr:metal ABC transporter ATP-binding protein [Mycobacterium sp. OTB74]MDH6243703.1 zinc/manganese transport system ATP-binding protein [Mycobacterium sp. OTB74]